MKKLNKLNLKFICNIILAISIAASFSACAPTYPKEGLPEAVKTVCKSEYNMDVDVTVAGKTAGIYYPMEGLLDVGMGISKDAWDKISNLILIASRVVLSTDADIQFYCVITQDAKLPELQVVIIKYVEDVKRGMYRNISRNESFKRTLFSINLTPQAKKERPIEKIFDEIKVEETTKEKMLDEFFRSPPTKLSDIGYWKGSFYLKDITMEEFLAAQIANRIKIDFRSDERIMDIYNFKTSEGSFSENEHTKYFIIKFKIMDLRPTEGIENLKVKKIQEILRIVNEVVYGYKFTDFDFLVLEDQLENVRLQVNAEDIYEFNKKRLPVEEIVQGPSGYFLQVKAQSN